MIYPVNPTNTVKVDGAFQKKNMAGREEVKELISIDTISKLTFLFATVIFFIIYRKRCVII